MLFYTEKAQKISFNLFLSSSNAPPVQRGQFLPGVFTKQGKFYFSPGIVIKHLQYKAPMSQIFAILVPGFAADENCTTQVKLASNQ